MQVLVTGSSGKIGRQAVKALLAAGHGVLGLDLAGGIFAGVRTVGSDCAAFGQVMGAVSGVDMTVKPEAIVHLAGIRSPALRPDHNVFTANAISTYNILGGGARGHSAGGLGFKRDRAGPAVLESPSLRAPRREPPGSARMVIFA